MADFHPLKRALSPPAHVRPFTWARLIGDCLLIVLVFFASSLVGAVVYGAIDAMVRAPADDGLEVLFVTAEMVAVIASTIACWPLIWWLARRRASSPRDFLAFRRVPNTALLLSCLVVALVGAISSVLAVWFDIPIPDYMVEMFEEADSYVLLAVAIVIAAPVLEEAFFRGYLFGALRELGLSAWITAVITSALFAALHVQYDWFYLVVMFALGMAIAWARVRYDSLIPCIAMHVFNNSLAMATLWLATA